MTAKDVADIEDKDKELTGASVENDAVEEKGLQSQSVIQPGRKRDRGKDIRLVSKSENEHLSPSMLSIARDLYSREGCLGFYRGVSYASSQSGLEKAAYFYGYGWLKALALRVSGGRELNTVTDLVLGYFAEALHLPLTMPIEVGEKNRFSVKNINKSLFFLVSW